MHINERLDITSHRMNVDAPFQFFAVRFLAWVDSFRDSLDLYSNTTSGIYVWRLTEFICQRGRMLLGKKGGRMLGL